MTGPPITDSNTDGGDPPLVSIIIATYNEGRFIEECLNSLMEQNYPLDRLEVLVVDGGSSDDTQGKVNAFSQSHPQIKLLENPRRIQVCAFNNGIQASSGDVVMIMSAHARYDRDYVRLCVEVLKETRAANVGGVWETRPGGSGLIARSIALFCTLRFGMGGARFRVGGQAGTVDTVPGGAYRRDVFEKVGLMDERLMRGEDNEFNARLRQHGMTVYFDPRIKTTYFARKTFVGFMKQLYGNGLYHILTLRVNRGGCSLRHLIPLAFVCSLVGCGIAGAFWSPAWWLGGGILGLYLPAVLASSAGAAAREGWRHLLVLPWLFFAAHMVYGFGTLMGILRFAFNPKYAEAQAPPFDETGTAG